MTDFPTSKDNRVDNVDDAVADDINSLQDKVGIDSSAVTTTHDYKLSGATGSDKAVSLTGEETLTNKTLTAPKIDDIVAATVDHITLTPGASKLVKVAVLRQNDTTNAYNNNSVILTGWGFILGDTTSQMTEAITFGVTFSSAPLIVANGFGSKTGSDPSVIANLTDAANHHAAPEVPSTTGFNIRLSRISADGDAVTGFGNTVRYAYAWIAIGQLT